jgi:acetylornithine deacetylase/succinyl-diaminopimelate desuccinylase-like protein
MTKDTQAVLDRIDVEELVQLALDLGNFDSPTGEEGPVAEFVYDWHQRQGFPVKKIAMFPTRPNVVATLPGTGGGKSLVFNSHLDTSIGKDDIWTTRRAADPMLHSAWRDGDMLHGNGICNNKGPMATWLIAAKAIRDSGAKLKGDLLLMSVVGEIGVEPVDEFTAPQYVAKEAGTRWAIQHGAVADYALVAEGTDFAIVGVEAGKAFFKITAFGNDIPMYTPYVERPLPAEKSPNAIVRMSKLIPIIEEWAYEYERRHRYEGSWGTVVPKVNIGAIRGGMPFRMAKTSGICTIYVDVRTTPIQNPVDIREELREVVAKSGVPCEVELYVYRRAYEATNAEPLAEAITSAHRQLLGRSPKPAFIPFSSMWRDTNIFNEIGIPSVNCGPGISVGGGHFAVPIAEMVTAAKLYALTALTLCNRERA